MADILQPQIMEEITQLFSLIPFNRTLGLKLTHIDSDYISMRFDMRPELIGNFMHNILHGGVISSVLDMAGGVAVIINSVFKHPDYTIEQLKNVLSKSSTVDLQISYIRPGKGEHFIAKAEIIHSGSKISFARMELFNQEDTLLATGTGTYHLA